MKNFDEYREKRALVGVEERSFQVGGETFVRRPAVRPEAVNPWEGIAPGMDQDEVLERIDLTVLALVEGGAKDEAHKRWIALRKRETDPVTLQDLVGLRDPDTGDEIQPGIVPWLIEEMAGRPTRPSSSSSNGAATTETTSTDASSSPATPEESKD